MENKELIQYKDMPFMYTHQVGTKVIGGIGNQEAFVKDYFKLDINDEEVKTKYIQVYDLLFYMISSIEITNELRDKVFKDYDNNILDINLENLKYVEKNISRFSFSADYQCIIKLFLLLTNELDKIYLDKEYVLRYIERNRNEKEFFKFPAYIPFEDKVLNEYVRVLRRSRDISKDAKSRVSYDAICQILKLGKIELEMNLMFSICYSFEGLIEGTMENKMNKEWLYDVSNISEMERLKIVCREMKQVRNRIVRLSKRVYGDSNQVESYIDNMVGVFTKCENIPKVLDDEVLYNTFALNILLSEFEQDVHMFDFLSEDEKIKCNNQAVILMNNIFIEKESDKKSRNFIFISNVLKICKVVTKRRNEDINNFIERLKEESILIKKHALIINKDTLDKLERVKQDLQKEKI